MPSKKGTRIEAGIWRSAEGSGYIAEVSYAHPQSGRRIREQRRFHRLDLAREWRTTRKVDAVRKELRRSKDEPEAREFGAFCEEYLELWSKVNKRASSYIRDQTSVKQLKKTFGGRFISEITRRDVEKYIAFRKSQGRTTATCNRELCCMKNMLRKAVDWDYLVQNPAGSIKQQREAPKEFEILSEPEIEAVLSASSGQLRVILILAIHTGMRRSEIFRLEWSDVSLTGSKQGRVRIRDSKNHDTRFIPLNSTAAAALSRHPKRIQSGEVCPFVFTGDTGLALTTVSKGFKGALHRAGVERHIRFHDLRHTFASHLVMKGVDLRSVASLLGHRDIKMTMRYAHLAPEHLQAAVDVLDAPGLFGSAASKYMDDA